MTNYSNAKKSFNLQLKSCNPQGTVAIRKVWLQPQSITCHPQSIICHPQSILARLKERLLCLNQSIIKT